MPTLSIREIIAKGDGNTAAVDVVDTSQAKPISFYQYESLTLTVQVRRDGADIQLPSDATVKLRAWVDGTIGTLYIDDTGTIDSSGRAVFTLTDDETGFAAGAYKWDVRASQGSDVTGVIASGDLTVLAASAPTGASFLGPSSPFLAVANVVAGTNVTITESPTGTITIAASGASVADGDKGDVVVSSSGAVWTVDSGAIDAGKLASNAVTTAKILDANVTTGKIADDAVTAAKLADTAVTAGSYGPMTGTVDAQGRLTAASTSSSAAIQSALGSVYFPLDGSATITGAIIASGTSTGLALSNTGATGPHITFGSTDDGTYPNTLSEINSFIGAGAVAGISVVAPSAGSGSMVFKTGSSFTPTTALSLGIDQSATFAGTINGNGSGLTNLDATDLTGTVPTARLGSGVADNTTYLRGDQTWATVTAGIGGTLGAVDNAVPRADGTGGVTAQASDLSILDASTSTANNVALTNIHAGQTNSSLVLSPKGTGAFIAGPRPDGTSTGGNARGAYAFDAQIQRNTAAQVASGASATVFGNRCTASGAQSFAAGYFATASGTLAYALGDSATASHDRSFVVGLDSASGASSDRVEQFKIKGDGGFTLQNATGTVTNWGKLSSAPVTGINAGDIFYNTTTNKHQGYNGTTWSDFY